MVPTGRERLGTLNTAKTLAAVPTSAEFALVSVQTQGVRVCVDGSTPVNTGGSEAGTPYSAGEKFWLEGRTEITQCKIIEQTASAFVEVAYFTADAYMRTT